MLLIRICFCVLKKGAPSRCSVPRSLPTYGTHGLFSLIFPMMVTEVLTSTRSLCMDHATTCFKCVSQRQLSDTTKEHSKSTYISTRTDFDFLRGPCRSVIR